jgi:pre-mRNA-processing factor 6
VPRSIELWLALAKLENYERAKAVLNRARDANPTEYTIYVAAAKLEEAQANTSLVQKIIHKAIRNL